MRPRVWGWGLSEQPMIPDAPVGTCGGLSAAGSASLPWWGGAGSIGSGQVQLPFDPGLSLSAPGDRRLSLLESWGRRGYTLRCRRQRAGHQSQEGRTQEGLHNSASEVAGAWRARKTLKMLLALEQGCYVT